MGYSSLADCLKDLERVGDLKIIDYPIDPCLEMAAIQRRAFKNRAPALLFRRPKGCSFPMLANLFGTRERLRFIFRDAIKKVERLFHTRPKTLFSHPLRTARLLPSLFNAHSVKVSPKKAPVLAQQCSLNDLPMLVSWPGDGGPFITLPLVFSQNPDNNSPNLGMYRIQLSGNSYADDEVGLHYQLQRGIGAHHAQALKRGVSLPARIHVGGPPSLTVAAVMPLPEGLSELFFAGILGGRSIRICKTAGFDLPILADCDFLISGHILPNLKPEGPFGDHMGYYSLRHDFPVLKVESVWHRANAIWPFTSVGRPPQEDTIFGDFIHELTGPLVGHVFEGVKQVHAVDVAGVHPLLLAIGSERYTPYEQNRPPREILAQALHLLGKTQTAQAKFLIITEEATNLDARTVPAFLRHILERTDFTRDLHFLTRVNCDTLDYSGIALNTGSKLIWASGRAKIRELGKEIRYLPTLPSCFANPRVVLPGIIVLEGPPHAQARGEVDMRLQNDLCQCLKNWKNREEFPLLAVVDDADFCAGSLDNFLWTVFTRADPATDSYGVDGIDYAKHWQCQAPFILDGRKKSFHAPELEEDPEIIARLEKLAVANGPLAGIF